MTVAPLIAMKSTKCESLEAVGKELDRRAHTYANDVDQSGRHVGYLCRAGDESPVPLEQAIERRMGELNTKRKIRDNQVRAMGFIVSTNEALPDEETAKEFLDRSVQWFGARYGYENLLAAQIHLDERYSRLAKETGRSRSFYVNEALQEAIDRFEYEYGILKDIEDYRAGRLETYSIDEVRAHCGLAN